MDPMAGPVGFQDVFCGKHQVFGQGVGFPANVKDNVWPKDHAGAAHLRAEPYLGVRVLIIGVADPVRIGVALGNPGVIWVFAAR